jgi:3-deoxy-D-manno-octulosonic-acid transferase
VIRLVYTAIFTAGLLLLAPVFAYRALRHRKYLGSLGERLGAVGVEPSDRPTLWVHAVSVGETLAVEPFVRAAVEAMPGWRVVVSTTTATGQRVARERFASLDVCYFPLDLPGAVDRALDRVRPSLVCLVETEIWPNFLAASRRRGIAVALVNGRLSDRSFRGYSRVRRLLAPVLRDVALFLMQTRADAERVRRLGAPPERVVVTGNLKYDVDREALEARLAPRRAEVDAAFGLPDPRPLAVAGSTAAGEEEMLAEALETLRRRPGLGRTRVLVAPRHPERFDEAERAFAGRGFRVARRSRPEGARDADVLLLDTIGELAAVYAHADAVLVGGSLVARGGHNILEPALYAKPVVVGPHTENFRQIVSDFTDAGAVVRLPIGAGAEALAEALARLLGDPDEARRIGERGLAVIEANRGATARTLDRVRALAGAKADPPRALGGRA